MGLKSWAKKQAKKAGKKAGEAKRKADEAKRAAERKAEEAKRKAATAAKRAANEAKKLADKAAKELTVGLIDELKKVASTGKREVKEAASSAAKKAIGEVEATVKERIPELIEEGLEEVTSKAAKGAAKQALKTACDVIETTAPDSYTLTLGIELALIVQAEVTVSLEIPNPVARLSKIREWANKPPSGRAQIIECVKDFAPASLTVEAKVSGNGGSATYSGEHLYDGVDKFLAKHGVD